jgi:hypothetical protein
MVLVAADAARRRRPSRFKCVARRADLRLLIFEIHLKVRLNSSTVTAQIWPRICLYQILFEGSIAPGSIESAEIEPSHAVAEAGVLPL